MYLVYADRVELARMSWRGFGAGLPSSAEDLKHLRYRYVDKGFIVEGVPVSTGAVLLRVKYMVNPKVLVNHREVHPREYLALRAGVVTNLVELALGMVRGYLCLG